MNSPGQCHCEEAKPTQQSQFLKPEIAALASVARNDKPVKSPRRVLIVHPYGIGDLLFVTPVLRALRLLPSVERVDLLLGSRTDAVVRANPHVDDIFVI